MPEIRGLIVTTTGKVSEYKQEADLGFKPMYRALSCSMVERLSLSNGIDLWLDEDGMYTQKKHNKKLSEIADQLTKYEHRILGAGIFLSTDDWGDLASLSKEDYDMLKTVLSKVSS